MSLKFAEIMYKNCLCRQTLLAFIDHSFPNGELTCDRNSELLSMCCQGRKPTDDGLFLELGETGGVWWGRGGLDDGKTWRKESCKCNLIAVSKKYPLYTYFLTMIHFFDGFLFSSPVVVDELSCIPNLAGCVILVYILLLEEHVQAAFVLCQRVTSDSGEINEKETSITAFRSQT